MNQMYLDTSALFKRYVNESGSKHVNLLFAQQTKLLTSALTICEVISNLRRLVDVDKVINESEFITLKKIFLADIGTGSLDIINFTPEVLFESLSLCSQRYVTPLDAIQLASALTLSEYPIFVCCDQKLLTLAEGHGLIVLDPNAL